MLRKIEKRFVAVLITIAVSACAGFAALVLICALPSGRVAAHVRDSGGILMTEGDYWNIVPSDKLSILDNFTDSIMLLTSGYVGEENCVDEAVHAYRTYKKKASKAESCSVCGAVPEEESLVRDYMTYWHGYKIFLKPLLFFFHINQIRQINALAILSWIVLISILLYRNQLKTYILPYLLGTAFLNIPAMAQSLQYSTIFHITSVFSVLLLVGAEREKLRDKCWLLFLFAGICTSYFDFLTYPVAVVGFLSVIYVGLLGVYGEYSYKTALAVLEKSVMWGAGYGGMWAMKWVIATLLSGENVFLKAFESFLIRSKNAVGESEFTVGQLYEMTNSYAAASIIKMILPLLLIAVLILVIRSGGFREKNNYIASAVLLVVACEPMMWYFLAKNHSYQHIFFTYRSMAVSFFAGAALLNPLLKSPVWGQAR